ncbi:MAG: chemotaxis response regulator protein-glutamate methylesterase [Candidatus Pacebacteria bacterium]|nr:chemotaxis response regulator protein-glutamate methylesterase [Candidatus Paceibacterota bacterium]
MQNRAGLARSDTAESLLKGGVVRVMVVDDSAVARGMLSRVIETDPELQVVAVASDGAMAVENLKKNQVEVIVLDLEMPNMDGMTALPLLLGVNPEVKIIISSNITRQNAELAFKAIHAGAKDYLSKPSTTSEMNSVVAYRRDLIAKIRALAGPKRYPRVDESALALPLQRTHQTVPIYQREKKTVVLRPLPPRHELPEMIAIGSSTGGPQALFAVLHELPDSFMTPIMITQHMPATFTTILAEHIARISKRPCFEAADGMVVEKGKIYVAPGDYHLLVESQAGQRVLRVKNTAPENFCRPSVDPMLRSIIEIYKSRVLTIILTGMGRDGQAGCQKIVEAGGVVVAQDEATSVVWGMPGSVATIGLCSAVIPLPKIREFMIQYATQVTS